MQHDLSKSPPYRLFRAAIIAGLTVVFSVAGIAAAAFIAAVAEALAK